MVTIHQMRNFTNETVFFSDIAELAKRVLSLLHWNTDLERIFTWKSDVKTKKQNRLKKVRTEAVLVIKSHLRTIYTLCSR